MNLFRVQKITSGKLGKDLVINGKNGCINFCANNYLGLNNHPRIIKAAKDTLDSFGFSMASARWISGTHEMHVELETKIAKFHGMEAACLYSSGFDANIGVFEALLSSKDAVFSDKKNHASIVDGVRLCRAEKHVYNHCDMADLEEKLKNSMDKRIRLIVTDGVFSMEGDVAPLP